MLGRERGERSRQRKITLACIYGSQRKKLGPENIFVTYLSYIHSSVYIDKYIGKLIRRPNTNSRIILRPVNERRHLCERYAYNHYAPPTGWFAFQNRQRYSKLIYVSKICLTMILTNIFVLTKCILNVELQNDYNIYALILPLAN